MSCVPELRFKEFSGEWEEKKLEEIADINPKSENLPDNFIYIDLESVENGLLKQKNQISKENAPSRAQRILVVEDILFQTVRPYQKNNLFFNFDDELYVSSTGYAQLRAIGNPNFLFQIIHKETFVNEVLKRCTGTSYPAINSNDLKKISLKFPSLEEQEKITNFLSKIDEKIAILEDKLQLWENYKKGTMQQLFSQELRFKDDEGNSYSDWEEKKFGDLFEFYSTNSFSRVNLNDADGKVHNIHYGDIHMKFSTVLDFDKVEVPFINKNIDLSKFDNDCYCKDGDLVIADASEDYEDIGKAIELKNINDKKVLAGLHTFLVRDESNLTIDGFRGYIFLDNKIKLQIKKIATGISVLGISKNNLNKISLNIPPLEEQEKIANFLTNIDEKIQKIANELKINKRFKKGLLQKMFCQ